MRKFLFALFLWSAASVNAQKMLFDVSVPSSEVPKEFRVKNEIAAHYSSIRYCRQSDFFRAEDFLITLTPGLVVKSVFRDLKQQPVGSVSYNGIIRGPVQGEVSISRFRDRISGLVLLHDGRKFIIDQTGPGYFALSEIREGSFTSRETGPDFLIPPPEKGGSDSDIPSAVGICDSAITCSSSSVIDLMILFTKKAQTGWSGYNNAIANITQAVNNMNTAMVNSGVNNVSYRLVHCDSIVYTEDADMGVDLSRLAGTSDGFMDSVHQMRNRYGADLVSLIVGSGNYCGIAYLNTSSTSYSSGSPSFNVTAYNCAVGNLTLSHELGHNMGLRHDWYVDGGTTPCSHHHGYVNQTAINLGASSTSSQRWRTIMAYNNHCSDVGFSCSRINRWSNPNQTYNGDPVGQLIGSAKPADEAFAFYRMACQVAAFRAEPTVCQAPSSLSSTSISTSSATLSWATVTNASSYYIEYRPSSDTVWILAAGAAATASLTISGLQPATLYYWRVRSNCSFGTSAFSQSQFSTAVPCATSPASLNTASITSSSATLSWGAVSGASGYDLQYKRSADVTWITLLTNTTSRSYNLTGLAASTVYNWRVRAVCGTYQSNYSQVSFTTAGLTVCNDAYESNNTSSTARSISVNKEFRATISSATDVDWFTFSTGNNNSTNVRVRLYNLSRDYDLYLYNSSLTLLDSSTSGGLTNDTVVFNSTLRQARYYIRIVAKNGESDIYNCYRFRNDISTTAFATSPDQLADLTPMSNSKNDNWFIYPVPARDVLNIFYESVRKSRGEILLTDVAGRSMRRISVDILPGGNQFRLNLAGHSPGVYIVSLLTSDGTLVKKLVIQK